MLCDHEAIILFLLSSLFTSYDQCEIKNKVIKVLVSWFSLTYFCLFSRKALTWKYYAKKILYYLRQQKILNNLKAFLQQPDDYESYLEGEALTEIFWLADELSLSTVVETVLEGRILQSGQLDRQNC